LEKKKEKGKRRGVAKPPLASPWQEKKNNNKNGWVLALWPNHQQTL